MVRAAVGRHAPLRLLPLLPLAPADAALELALQHEQQKV